MYDKINTFTVTKVRGVAYASQDDEGNRREQQEGEPRVTIERADCIKAEELFVQQENEFGLKSGSYLENRANRKIHFYADF